MQNRKNNFYTIEKLLNLSLKKAADLSVCLSFMNKTIILAGNGQLPCHVVEELKIRNLDFVIIGFENNEISLKLKKCKYQIINFGKIITKLKHLKKRLWKYYNGWWPQKTKGFWNQTRF